MMYQIFKDLDYVKIYLDDISVISASVRDHLKHLSEVARRLEKANLSINPQKNANGSARKQKC